MSDRTLLNFYSLVKTYASDSEIFRTMVGAIGTLSAIARLLEVRLEELERTVRQLETAAYANDFPNSIDGRVRAKRGVAKR